MAARPQILVLLLLTALPLLVKAAGCGSASPFTRGRSIASSIVTTTDNRNRTFNIYVPSVYDFNSPTPLLFFFHGFGGTGALAERYGMDDFAESLNFITVYPDGYLNSWNVGTCCAGARAANIDDVGFVSQLIDQLSSQLCIDPSRVYAVGYSNGAMLSHRLGCELSNKIVGIAPVEGTIQFSPCQPTNKVVVYEIHGTADPTVRFNGGSDCLNNAVPFTSVNYTLGVWLSVNGCGSTFTSSYTLLDATCYTYAQGCINPVTLCIVLNGSHAWSGANTVSNSTTGNCPGGIDGKFPATQEIANYLLSVSRSSGSTLTGTLPTNAPSPTTATNTATTSAAATTSASAVESAASTTAVVSVTAAGGSASAASTAGTTAAAAASTTLATTTTATAASSATALCVVYAVLCAALLSVLGL